MSWMHEPVVNDRIKYMVVVYGLVMRVNDRCVTGVDFVRGEPKFRWIVPG
jgi:hypothetical protein